MKVIETKVYEFKELSDEAKEKAKEWYRSVLEYPWFDEANDTMNKFAELVNVKIVDYSYGGLDRRGVIKFRLQNKTCSYLKGVRLWKYLINNMRLDEVKFETCPFTGMSFDWDISYPLNAFLKRPNKSETMYSLVDECFNSFIIAVEADVAGQYTDDAVLEAIEANEYTFTEDGQRAG